MALTRAQYLSGNVANGAVLSGQPQGVRPGGMGISIAPDGVISIDLNTVEGLVKLNNATAYNDYIWPNLTPTSSSALASDAAGNLTWERIGGTIGTVSSVDVSGGTTGLTFSGGPITSSGVITMGGVLGIANGGTSATTSSTAINNLLPSQSGRSGYYLSTNGSSAFWVDPNVNNVTRIVAGANITISPTGGTGVVTINSTASGTITGVTAGNGLTGGGTSGTVTLNVGAGAGITVAADSVGITSTGVTAGSYTSANITVNAQGQITSASNGSNELPAQTGNSTKFLTTNGTTASWGALRTPRVTATSLTAVANDYVVVTASGQTITLPASPYAGAVVTVVVAGTFLNTVVARNGSNIMGLAENITLDKRYAAMQFTYTDVSNGWRLN